MEQPIRYLEMTTEMNVFADPVQQVPDSDRSVEELKEEYNLLMERSQELLELLNSIQNKEK